MTDVPPIVDIMERRPPPADVQTCRVCGCWDFNACWDDELGACFWVEDDLCSHCSLKEGLADA